MARPVVHGIERVKPFGERRCKLNAFHEVGARFEHLQGVVGKRHVACHRVYGRSLAQVFLRNAEFLEQVSRGCGLELHDIAVLHVVGLFVGFAVEVNNAVSYLQRLSGQADATLYVKLAVVNGAAYHLAEHLGVLEHILTPGGVLLLKHGALLLPRKRIHVHYGIYLAPHLVAYPVEVAVLLRKRHGVARGIVENHDVVELHFTEALDTLIVPRRFLDVRLAAQHGERIRHQRH